MFVHRADRLGHALGEPDHPGDLRAALAAHREDALAAAARPEHREAAETTQLGDERAALADVFPGIGQLLRHAPPVAQPDRALHFLIGAAKEVVDDRGVARAAGVLQEQRVEEIGLLGRRQTERLSDAQADEAASGRMAARMSLGQIERMRQTFENARQPKARVTDPDADERSVLRLGGNGGGSKVET